jgi:hypothetical protein
MGLTSETQASASVPAVVANLAASTSAASIPAALDKGKGRPAEDTSAANEVEAPVAPAKKRRLAVVEEPPTGKSPKTADKTATKPKRKSRLAAFCEHCQKSLHDGGKCHEGCSGPLYSHVSSQNLARSAQQDETRPWLASTAR